MIMKYEAYWISPEGIIIPVPDHHIDMVIENPAMFGMTMKKISAMCKKYKEPLHMEGFAREEIMKGLMENGWVRIRYSGKPDSFTIQIFKLDDKIKKHLRKWATGVTKDFDKVPNFTGYRLSEIRPDGKTITGTLKVLTHRPGSRTALPVSKQRAGIIRKIQDKKVRAYIELLEETGLRPAELLSVTIADVDFSRALLNLSPVKSMAGTGRSILLSKNSMEFLKENISPGEVKLFPGLTLSKVSNAWRKACEDAGIKSPLHGIRAEAIAKRMNMRDAKTTAHYLNPEKRYYIIDSHCGSGKTHLVEYLIKKGILKKGRVVESKPKKRTRKSRKRGKTSR
jgi:hypothetical protein